MPHDFVACCSDWLVDLKGRQASSPAADVVFRWTSDGRAQVYIVRPRLTGLSECDAWHIAQAAQRAIARESETRDGHHRHAEAAS
jgi:hypothetical protein